MNRFALTVKDENYIQKNALRAERRRKNYRKAVRKQHISNEVYGFSWYKNLHEFSKNKIHCSCLMCRYRSAWDPERKPVGDKKRIIAMQQDLNELESA